MRSSFVPFRTAADDRHQRNTNNGRPQAGNDALPAAASAELHAVTRAWPSPATGVVADGQGEQDRAAAHHYLDDVAHTGHSASQP
jgi:hypothetical protein